MKKLILFLGLFLLACTTVLAQSVPHPVFGHLTNDGDGVSNVEIKYENFNTGIASYKTTENQGYYQFELGNIDVNYRNGDNVKVTVTFCSGNPACSKSVTLSGGGNDLSFDISGVAEQITYICSDGSTVIDLNDCPKPAVVVDDNNCPDCNCDSNCPSCNCPSCVGEDCQDCEDAESNLLWINLLVGILSAAGGAGIYFGLFNKRVFTGVRTGMKTYRGRNGELKILHKHPGTTGYHDPNTNHGGIEKHPKGMIDVLKGYQKNEDGEWEYQEE